jgi:hypothetical protein
VLVGRKNEMLNDMISAIVNKESFMLSTSRAIYYASGVIKIDARGITIKGVTVPECGYCRDCKWRKEDGECEMTVNGWQSDKIGQEHQPQKPLHPESLSCAQDDERYKAWLEVQPNFGCIQWQKREEV